MNMKLFQTRAKNDECSLHFLNKPGLAEVCWQLKDQQTACNVSQMIAVVSLNSDE